MDWKGTGTDTSHFRFVGCLEVRSCLLLGIFFSWGMGYKTMYNLSYFHSKMLNYVTNIQDANNGFLLQGHLIKQTYNQLVIISAWDHHKTFKFAKC